MDAVTAILVERGQDGRGLRPMVVFSTLAHLVVVIALIVSQGSILGRHDRAPAEVMTISLGGAPGPRSGGTNPLAGRPVQREVAEPPARPEPVRPPAAKTPEMSVPVPGKARPQPREKFGEVKQAPEDARGRTPTTDRDGRSVRQRNRGGAGREEVSGIGATTRR